MADTGPGAGERMVGVRFTDDVLSVGLFDGRTITVPIAWYPRLLHATHAERVGALVIHGAREALADKRKTRRRMRIEPPTTCPTAEACLEVHPDVWSAHVRAVRVEARKDMDAAVREGAHERARHWRFFAEVLELDPRDWAPFGLMERERLDGFGPDCSAGCAWFLKIQGDAGSDWGVCGNPASHRVGRLTFEHQGCPEFEQASRRRAPQARPRR